MLILLSEGKYYWGKLIESGTGGGGHWAFDYIDYMCQATG